MGYSRSRGQTWICCVSCTAGGFFTPWAIGECAGDRTLCIFQNPQICIQERVDFTVRKFYKSLIGYPISWVQFSQFSYSVVSDCLLPQGSQQTRTPCPSPTSRAYSNSCPSIWWCNPAISSSVLPFSSCPQSLPASGSIPMSQLFAPCGQSTVITIRRWNVDCSKSICMSQTLKSVRLKWDHLNNFVKQYFA